MSLNKRWLEQQAEQAPTERLEHARQRVRVALRAAEECSLTVSTADDIARTLTSAMRELEALQLTVAVMERKAR